MKALKLLGGSFCSTIIDSLSGPHDHASGAFLEDKTPVVVLSSNTGSISHDGWLVEFVPGKLYHEVHPFECSGNIYAHGIYRRVRKLEESEMSAAVRYFTRTGKTVRIELQNPGQQLHRMLAKWQVGEGYVQTCRSSTCSCASHDSGFNWTAYELPMAVAIYLDDHHRIKRWHGDVHSHGSYSWNDGPLERELKDRGEGEAEKAKDLIEIFSPVIRRMVIPAMGVRLLSLALAGDNTAVQELYRFRGEQQEQLRRERAKKFAHRDGVNFPQHGSGWRFISA